MQFNLHIDDYKKNDKLLISCCSEKIKEYLNLSIFEFFIN